MPDSLFIVMAGGRGRGLAPLTDYWPKPLIRLGPSGRLIDFTLYNCLTSDLGDALVLTQGESRQIELYLKVHWMGPFIAAGKKLTVLPGSKTPMGSYRGTADAVFAGLALSGRVPDEVVVLAADHVYRMDYRPLVDFHRSHGQAATLAAADFEREDAPRLGIISPGGDARVESFHEKPANLEAVSPPGGRTLASVGAYVFNREPLLKYLEWNQEESSHDLGGDVIPRMVAENQARYFSFINPDGSSGFWRDLGNLRAYWRLHMDLINGQAPGLVTGFSSGLTRPPFARLDLVRGYESGRKRIESSMISNSAWIDAATVERSVIGPGVRVESHSVVKNSVLLDGAVVREGAVLEGAVVEPRVEVRPESTAGSLSPLKNTRPLGVHQVGDSAEFGLAAALASERSAMKGATPEDE